MRGSNFPLFYQLLTGFNMDKTTYKTIRRSIRDNGLRYTTSIAQFKGDIQTLTICDFVANTMRLTDWLSLRQSFARSERASIAFKLTTSTHGKV
jgi:hypothetical protein